MPRTTCETTTTCETIEATFYRYLYGEYETLRLGWWLYVHAAILLATMLAGYAVARGRPLLVAALLPFPLYYGYRRYEDARPTE